MDNILRVYPHFIRNSRNILRYHNDYIKIYEFENEYIYTFQSSFSPLFGLSQMEKAAVLSLIPDIVLKIIEEEHPILGKGTAILVRLLH